MLLGIRAKIRNGLMLAYRNKYRLSQAEAARLAGVTLSAWNCLECMRFDSVVGKQSAGKIAFALGVEVEQIAPEALAGTRFKTERIVYADVSTDKLLESKASTLPMLECEQAVDNPDMKAKIEEVLKTLTPRERKALKLRFGLDDGVSRTYEEVGIALRIGGPRAREIEQKAIRKLQHPRRVEVLKGFIADGQ